MDVTVFTGKKFENTEMFGQYPLQVNGFKDLHECLEAAMIEGEIESLHSAENSAKSGQEVCNASVFIFQHGALKRDLYRSDTLSFLRPSSFSRSIMISAMGKTRDL